MRFSIKILNQIDFKKFSNASQMFIGKFDVVSQLRLNYLIDIFVKSDITSEIASNCIKNEGQLSAL